MKLRLRDYQESGLASIRMALSGRPAPDIEYRRGHAGRAQSVVYVLPTGGGKTVVYAAIAEGAASKGNRVLIEEHRKELIYQASMALAALGVPHRVIAPSKKIAELRRRHVERYGQPYVDMTANVAVASVQTLVRRIPWLEQFRPALLVCDEAHHALAGSWATIREHAPQAAYLGVTATPCRRNGEGLEKSFEAMVHGPSMARLVDDGFLCSARVFAPPMVASMDGVGSRQGDYDPKAMASILDRPTVTGDAVQHYGRLASGRPAIVFCCNRKHAAHVAEQFQAAGWRFEVIDGTLDDHVRDRMIDDLSARRIQGLVSVDVISEGTDVPAAEVAIMLRATQSLGLYLQQVGRVLRPIYADGALLDSPEQRLAAIADGPKPTGLVIDHVGNVLRHGMPIAERYWTLIGREPGKRKAKDADDEIAVSQCPACYLAHPPAPQCPACGHVYIAQSRNPREQDGELAEIEETAEQREQRETRIAQGRARTKEALEAQGMSSGRAEHILRARREKERLQTELREMISRYEKRTGRSAAEEFGVGYSDVTRMTPKPLRKAIEHVGSAMFDMAGAAGGETGDLEI